MGTEKQVASLGKYTTVVHPDWIDYNGHMTESRYLEAFGNSTDALLAYIGATPEYVSKEKKSYYTVETHIMNKAEVSKGEPIVVNTQILKSDEKRIHLIHVMRHGQTGSELATAEQMLLHVDCKVGRACANEDATLVAKLRDLTKEHEQLETPAVVGRFVGKPRQ